LETTLAKDTPSFVTGQHCTRVLVTLYEVQHILKHHTWLHHVEQCQCLPAVYVSITTCNTGTAGKVKPFSNSMVAAAQLLQCQRKVTCPCQDPVVLADNVQAVCGYIETSLYSHKTFSSSPQVIS